MFNNQFIKFLKIKQLILMSQCVLVLTHCWLDFCVSFPFAIWGTVNLEPRLICITTGTTRDKDYFYKSTYLANKQKSRTSNMKL